MSENRNSLVCISGVRGYEEDGVAYLHVEDVARGLGFERTELKNGVEYTSIRWERVDGFLNEFRFRPQVGENGNPHDYYIPENIFYRLCMKAKNEVAEAFQAKVADEMSKTTLWRWLEKLEKARRISLVSDMKLVNVPTTTGAKSTTFYNLNVLNQLAMVCIDNEKLNDISCKFSDILSEAF